MPQTIKNINNDGRVTLEIQIHNQRFVVKGDEDEADIREVAEMVRRKIEALRKRSPAMNVQKAVMVAAFDFASEVIKAKRKAVDFRSGVLTKTQSLVDRLHSELNKS